MSTIHITPAIHQAQQIAAAAYASRITDPIHAFRRWTLAGLLMKRAHRRLS